MENASKALIMAGSILISIMVIALVVISYNQIVGVQQTKNNADIISKMTEYSKKFEQYNTSIYGSELLSLGNLQEDYNYRQAELQGYSKVNITVKIKNQIKENGTTYLKQGEQSLAIIRNGLGNLEEKIADYEKDSDEYKNKKEKGEKSVKYYAQLSNRQIALLFDINFKSNEPDYDIGDRLAKENSKTAKLLKDIKIYKDLKTAYTEFKNKRFTCSKTEYDVNGRIKTMYYTEN